MCITISKDGQLNGAVVRVTDINAQPLSISLFPYACSIPSRKSTEAAPEIA